MTFATQQKAVYQVAKLKRLRAKIELDLHPNLIRQTTAHSKENYEQSINPAISAKVS